MSGDDTLSKTRARAPTRTLPDGRIASIVPADEAGEFYLQAPDWLLDHLAQSGILTPRQIGAGKYLAECYGKGGFSSPHRRTGAGNSRCDQACPENGKCDCPISAKRREFDDIIGAAPRATHAALRSLCQGEWYHLAPPVPLWKRGLDAIADRLGYAKDA